ncbi:MAG: alpha/beta hydrolase [Ruminococcaceae bacterium]|nr:alpha/beta hydrolase [Oscillospiraceae bacterium]
MGNNFSVLKDIPYGEHERQKFDIYIPENPHNKSGVILLIHGGGWSNGDKSDYKNEAGFYASSGYICAAINYRFVSGNINVFHELDDITSALNAIKEKCEEYGFNIKNTILTGASAGAHLSLLYAYTRKSEAPIIPVAVGAFCPPVNCWAENFLIGIKGEFEDWKYGVLSNCCGTEITKNTLLNESQQNALKKMSPQTYVSKECVPTAVFQGVLDDLVPFEYSEIFIETLKKAGVKNDFLVYENSGHALDKDPDKTDESRKIVLSYAEMYL